MKKIFKGRPIITGNLEGEALVTHSSFNNLASFYNSVIINAKEAICSDQNNEELYKKNLTGKIICLPRTSGSTSAGATWDTVAYMNIAPKALLFSEHIDSLGASGMVLAHIWAENTVYVIDQLGDDFLHTVQNGDKIIIQDDGTVIIKS